MNLGKETETLEFKKSTGEIKEGMVSISSILRNSSRYCYTIIYFPRR